jgi:hypothetical protein
MKKLKYKDIDTESDSEEEQVPEAEDSTQIRKKIKYKQILKVEDNWESEEK